MNHKLRDGVSVFIPTINFNVAEILEALRRVGVNVAMEVRATPGHLGAREGSIDPREFECDCTHLVRGHRGEMYFLVTFEDADPDNEKLNLTLSKLLEDAVPESERFGWNIFSETKWGIDGPYVP